MRLFVGTIVIAVVACLFLASVFSGIFYGEPSQLGVDDFTFLRPLPAPAYYEPYCWKTNSCIPLRHSPEIDVYYETTPPRP